MESDVVVLIHGLARTRGSMLPLAIVARANGHRVINWGYPSRRRTIEEHADAMAGELGQTLRETDGHVHFITHSLGGIIVRAFLARHPLANIGRVVMLGPPNHGSEIADILRSFAIYRIVTGRPGEELGTGRFSTPNSLPHPSCEVGVIAGSRSSNPLFSQWIGSESDGKVAVDRTRLDRMKDFAVVRRNHTFLPWSPNVIAMALRFVDSGRFAA